MNSKVSNRKKAIACCKVRGELYAALSLYFSLPSEKMLRDLTKDLFSHMDGGLFDSSPDFVSVQESFCQFQALAHTESEKETREAAHRFNVEYTRLFLVPSDSRIFLYETMHQKSNELLMGAAAQEVSQIYREDGLALHGTFQDLPDHFTVQCEYLAHMARREGKAWIQGEPLQAEIYFRRSASFFDRHLGSWGPSLCALILEQAQTDFYRALASLTDKFMAWDMKMRNEAACWL